MLVEKDFFSMEVGFDVIFLEICFFLNFLKVFSMDLDYVFYKDLDCAFYKYFDLLMALSVGRDYDLCEDFDVWPQGMGCDVKAFVKEKVDGLGSIWCLEIFGILVIWLA